MSKSSNLFTFLLALSVNATMSQTHNLGDTLQVNFLNRSDTIRIVNQKKDLDYYFTYSNLTSRQVSIYSKLVFDVSPSIFANYDCKLYKEVNGKYEKIDHYGLSPYGYYMDSLYAIYKLKADSVLNLFDISKRKLAALETDTLRYNILENNYILEPGEYKFQIFLRVRTKYTFSPGKVNIDEIEYVNSDWYYFRVIKKISWDPFEK